MATHSSVLAWRIPGTGGPGGLPSMGSHRVGHDWNDLAVAVIWMVNDSKLSKRYLFQLFPLEEKNSLEMDRIYNYTWWTLKIL